MTINLITKADHANLLTIFNSNPNLILQNKGYETLDKTKFTDEDTAKFNEVTAILKKSIHGFRSFTNFRRNKDQQIEIRLQYAYDVSFTGVGYILLDELLNGFKD